MQVGRSSRRHSEQQAHCGSEVHTLTGVLALVGGLGFGLVALGMVSAPVRTSGIAAPARPSPAVALTRAAAAMPTRQPADQDWSLQLDEATLSRDVNVWASQQPPVQTPLGMARLQDVTVSMRDNQL